MGRKSKPVEKAPVNTGGCGANDDETSAGLHEEIALVREFIRRSRDLAAEGRTLDELLQTLDVVSRASTRLATLLKTQRTLDETPDLSDALARAFEEVIKEVNS